mmetsp:Transcript_69405/g.194630  ORF Transcript_69405/g.194630 Transcript_69405/m.194630 type:complete len:203 (-) Transcript_69405:664-1272(-)
MVFAHIAVPHLDEGPEDEEHRRQIRQAQEAPVPPLRRGAENNERQDRRQHDVEYQLRTCGVSAGLERQLEEGGLQEQGKHGAPEHLRQLAPIHVQVQLLDFFLQGGIAHLQLLQKRPGVVVLEVHAPGLGGCLGVLAGVEGVHPLLRCRLAQRFDAGGARDRRQAAPREEAVGGLPWVGWHRSQRVGLCKAVCFRLLRLNRA